MLGQTLTQLPALCSPCTANAYRPVSIVSQQLYSTRRKTRPTKGPKITAVLTKDVEGLGWEGKVVTVKGGFFRNTLLPQGSVRYAGQEDLAKAKQLEDARKELDKSKSDYDIRVASIVRKMTKEPLTFQRSPKHSFEITKEHIVRQFRRQLQLEVNPDAIQLAENPRTIGDYFVDVHVDDSTVATTQLSVAVQ